MFAIGMRWSEPDPPIEIRNETLNGDATPKRTAGILGTTILIAILLMVVHAAWAFVVLRRQDEEALTRFHRFSVFVWAVWLIPYFSPMFFAIAGA